MPRSKPHWKIRIAESWDENDLTLLECKCIQLYGFGYDDEEFELLLRYVDFEVPFAKQMLFEADGHLFFCDEMEWWESTNEEPIPYNAPASWRKAAEEARKKNPPTFDCRLTGRIVSRY